MAKASRGLRAGTRRKLKKEFGSKFTVTNYLRSFKVDERVTISQNPSSHKGMPYIRFKGAAGVVKGRRGGAYIVEIKSGNKKKTVIARPEHLAPADKR